MSEQAFTPGPWQVLDDYHGRWTIVGDMDGEYFTDSPSPVMSWEFVANLEDEYGEVGKHAAANRRLILAAPDLLEALTDCLGWHDFADDAHKPVEVRAAYMRARAAIAKALGPLAEGVEG